ncbi:LysR family transcriptional regulator [Temperatibacter marinus]|uniref:LysR family transcriptional regulator n=1 Tax=Temperatibacter marinus TaxID=1456591 RepID=A0AA52H883_9PROT|nr:LysR family transcriptional regulator [Temperatibacter marinus]WND01569.1 LysR family transcriptional regulator [Temperatibacter marinus]
MPLDWDKLRIFQTVAEAGSFTTAGSLLNSSQSAISRQIKALEEAMNVSLFTRHARGLVLTQEGQQLFQTTQEMTQKIDETQRDLAESKGRPFGTLRVTTMVTFGAVWLTNHIRGFLEQYPEIDIQLILDDRDLDLSAGEADVAIRLHEIQQTDLIQRPLASFHSHIYASPEYLDRNGMPSTPEEIDHHDIIAFGNTVREPLNRLNYTLTLGKTGKPRAPRMQINNLYGILNAVEQGVGIAALPDYLTHNRKNLVRVLEDQTEDLTFPSYFCYPPELRGSKRLAVFRDYLIQQIRAEQNIL